MITHDRDALLLTPGPLTTSLRTKQSMLHDWGSWDAAFNAVTAEICSNLLSIAHGSSTHECIPLQGSGTFAVEAALSSLSSKDSRFLVPVNGAYGSRIVKILQYLNRPHEVLEFAEDTPICAKAIDQHLRHDTSLSHVVMVHCETGTGIVNPLTEVARVVQSHQRTLMVDAMSSFGAFDIDVEALSIGALIAASGKCLEGVPGMGFIIAKHDVIVRAAGQSHSLAMDLHEQWVYLQKTGQWRFTPPTHVVVALREAIRQFNEEGGQAARWNRYQANGNALLNGMKALGVELFLNEAIQAPIIYTFKAPTSANYDFQKLYIGMRERGFIIYPGKLTQIETFRIGCIGALTTHDMNMLVHAFTDVWREMSLLHS